MLQTAFEKTDIVDSSCICTDLFMMILHIEILPFMPNRTTDAFWKGWARLKLYSLHKNTKSINRLYGAITLSIS